ncbi:MAG: DHA1 family tetracycline resistance protein-like MFS transporter, partial [Loktanella salsilacus]
GLIGAAFGVGFVIGPMLGGALAVWGVRAPFYAAALLAALNLGFGWLILPETVTDRIRRPFTLARANPLGALRHIAALPGLAPLLAVSFIYTMAFFVYPAIWAYYGQARFGWGPGMIGLSLGFFGIGIAIVQGLLMKPILRVLGERNTVFAGLAVDVGVFIFLGFVTSGWLALALTPLTALGSVAGPALQGIMSRRAADNQQGELQGVLTGVNAIATIIGPLLMTQTFWLFTAASAPIYLPGAPFLLAAGLVVLAVAVFMRARTAF